MEVIDISDWNARAEKAFMEAKIQLPKYEKELSIIVNVLSKALNTEERLSLEKKANELENLIDDLGNDTSLGFYLLEVQNHLLEFSKADLKKESTPFMKRDRKVNTETKELSRSFLNLLRKYNSIINLELPDLEKPRKSMLSCECGNSKDFESIDDGRLFYCLKCSVQIKETIGAKTTYKDTDRVNVTGKYKYTRMIHMRNCVRQYQGKQKVRIPPQLLKEVQDQLELNGTVKKISPQHIRNALQETGWSDHYENFVLIWSMITGKECPEISVLEDQIYQDFEQIEREYNIIMCDPLVDRSSFMSYPYVLYQILGRHGCKADLDFFNMLKTDRLNWLDDILGQIYIKLEWPGFNELA